LEVGAKVSQESADIDDSQGFIRKEARMTTASMSDPFSSLSSSTDYTQASSQSASTAKATSGQDSQKTTSNTQAQQDEVKISLAAQAQALKGRGESVNQIAQTLGVTAKVIDTYLGIPQTTSSSGSAAAQYSASQVSQLLGSA
jgi:hypothetical protein